MSEENFNKNNYDVVSISKPNQTKRSNYVQDALFIGKQHKDSGQFVKVFSDIFLKHEARRKSYV